MRKLLISKRNIAVAALAGLVLCLLAYFALDIPFFEFEDAQTRASLTTSASADGTLAFSYDGDAIILREPDGLSVTVYALTVEGTTALEQTEIDSLTQDYMGSFAAVASAQSADTDGDGVAETVYAAAKTDMEFTQGYLPSAPAFLTEEIPFEAVFQDRTTFYLYYGQTLLISQEVEIVSGLGNVYTLTTDESGAVAGIDTNDVRSGLTFIYRPSGTETYVMRYQVEDNSLFTLRHLRAMLPFLLIIALSAACIALDVVLRRRLYKKTGAPAGRAAPFVRENTRERLLFDFNFLRWSVMAVSFVLLIYGARIAGRWFSDVMLPVFSCPYNQDQLIGSSCYMLSHLSFLSDYSLREILLFVGGFLLSAVVLGRILCGFVCPLGFLQDIVHEIRQAFHAEGIALTEKLYAVLRLIKWVMLLIFLGIGFLGGNFCDFCPALALSPAFAGFQISLYFSGFLMVAVIVASFFKRRAFCNVCPLGYLLGILHKFSLFRLKKDCQACTECGACYEACPMGIKSIYTEREKTDITTSDCILCGECVRQCPEDNAIAITFCGRRVYASSRLKFMRRAATRARRKRHGKQ